MGQEIVAQHFQQRDFQKFERRLRAETDRLAADLEAARAQRQVVTRIITREVPRYVREPAPACADAGLHSGGFRVLHDAAAAGVVPDPARVADAPAVGAAAAAGTIVDNYAACLDWRAQVIGWQQWYRTATEAAP